MVFTYFIFTIRLGVQQCLVICISLMTNQTEQLLLPHRPSEYARFGEMPVRVLCLLKTVGGLPFSTWVLRVLDVFQTRVLYGLQTARINIVSHSALPFPFFNKFFLKEEVLTVTLSAFLFWLGHFALCLEHLCLTQDLETI